MSRKVLVDEAETVRKTLMIMMMLMILTSKRGNDLGVCLGSMGSSIALKYVAFAPCSPRDSGVPAALCRRWKVIRMGRRVSFFSQKLRSASVVLSHVSHRLCKWQDTNRLPLAAFCQQDGANEMGMKRATWKKYFTNKFACRSKVSLR